MSEVNWQEQVKALIDGEKYEDAIAFLSSGFKKYDHPDYDLYLGLIYLLKQDKEKASETWLVGSINSNNIEVFKANLLNLLEFYGFTLANQRKLDQVRKILDVILEIREDYQNPDLDKIITLQLESLYNSGISYVQNKQYAQAESSFKQILCLLPNDSLTWYNLAVLYYEINEINKAYRAINNAINLEYQNANYFYLLGLIEESFGHSESLGRAILAYNNSINLKGNNLDAYNNLGNCYRALVEYEKAEQCYRQAIAIDHSHCGSYVNLAKTLLLQKHHEEALKICKKAGENTKLTIELYDNWIEILNQMNRTLEAISIGEKIIKKFPEDLFLRRKVKLLLPSLYNSVEEIQFYRQRFSQGLSDLMQEIYSGYADKYQQNMMNYIWHSQKSETNFFLAYQGQNDLNMQKQYGKFIQAIVQKSYPQFCQPLLLNISHPRKIRLGYISARMNTVLGQLTSGWIKYQNRNKFEIYAYNLGQSQQNIYQRDFQLYSDYYSELPQKIEVACDNIRQDNLDILIFIDIGMDPIMTILAAMRLAPIQCTTWSHPVTSGLPSIDYFLSSDLMEPDEGESHYSEKLIRLPNLGIAFPEPSIPALTLNRFDFGLDDDAIIYLSCQSQFKYLPQYDFVYPAIAHKVSQAKFLFLESSISLESQRDFEQRLGRAFSNYGLNHQDYCIFLHRLTHDRYLQVNQLSDIFLDTFSWSGGITTLHALACDLPVVTCPGTYMRGRHSYGILKMLGCMDTIANSEEDYINIAVRLGLDLEFRQRIVTFIQKYRSQLYDDVTCVEFLEDFFWSQVFSCNGGEIL